MRTSSGLKTGLEIVTFYYILAVTLSLLIIYLDVVVVV